MRVVRRPQFLDDLYDAYAWINPDSERAAERLIERVEAMIERLGQYPMIGAPREPLAPGLRSIRVRPFRHLIFYRIGDDEIVLIRLLHSARALEQERFEG
ncbi:MAG: type II toxin-antitoxin system RelE/ParE family toxin [Micropepsaceae bacterium]